MPGRFTRPAQISILSGSPNAPAHLGQGMGFFFQFFKCHTLFFLPSLFAGPQNAPVLWRQGTGLFFPLFRMAYLMMPVLPVRLFFSAFRG